MPENNNNIEMSNRKTTVASLAKSDKYIEKFTSLCSGSRELAMRTLSSISLVVANNPKLKECDPNEVIMCGATACTVGLDVTPTLGLSAIVPFNKWNPDTRSSEPHPQFQIMVKGLKQLAKRSGQYVKINSGCVYSDEYRGRDFFTGDIICEFVNGGYRDRGEESQIVGYFAYIKEVNGFEKTVYWSKEDVLHHAMKYSKTYNQKKGEFTKGTPWAENFSQMAEKTVMKHLLNNYGTLSIDFKNAINADQSTGVDNDGNYLYEDNPQNDENKHDSYHKTGTAGLKEMLRIGAEEAVEHPVEEYIEFDSNQSQDDIANEVFNE